MAHWKWSGLWWRRGVCETELMAPPRELCVSTTPSQAPEAPVGPDCGRVGAEEQLLNKSASGKSRAATIWSSKDCEQAQPKLLTIIITSRSKDGDKERG